VLEALSRQIIGPQTKWEIILIDNASVDGTAKVATQGAAKHSLTLRVVREPKAGLSYARQRGVEEAVGEIISFVDDDNIVCDDWVENCVRFMRDHPRAGLVGGKIVARFVDPTSKPVDFEKRFAGALACWDHGDRPFCYPPPVHYPPCGAGLTLRRKILIEICGRIRCHLTDRIGDRLVSGGDYELALLALRMGWEAWYSPELRMEHVLPPGRLTENYLRRLRLGNAESERWLEYLRGKEPRRGRLWYLRSWFHYRRGWAWMRLLSRIRRNGHPDAADYPYWAQDQELRAIGAWRLFRDYPFARVERWLEQHNSSTRPCACVATAPVEPRA
jgi:glycosyltransferase involved in cell wall biosynthesis